MWFKQQTPPTSSNDPYLGPPKNGRQEPIFDSTPQAETPSHKPVTPLTVDIDAAFVSAPIGTVKPQFQPKVANQSHHQQQVVTKKTPIAATQSPTQDIFTIPEGVAIEGNIDTKKPITIAGSLKGDINQAPQLLLLPTGKIVGDINCQTAEISGHVQGHMVVLDLLVCRASAVINGNISYGRVRVEAGAVLNGTLAQNDKTI
jgi:cytoskeletal protein CcmA (bactofilin family)